LKTTKPLIQKQSAPPESATAVTVFELTDPGTAGENIEILDQDIVHLGPGSFCAKRIMVNLDKSAFIFHNSSHRVRSRTKTHPAMAAFFIIGPQSRVTIDGRAVNSNSLVAAEPGIEVEIVGDAAYESFSFLLTPAELIQHFSRRQREEAYTPPKGIEIWRVNDSDLRYLYNLGKRLVEIATSEPEILNNSVDIRAAIHIELLESVISMLEVGELSEITRLEKTSQRYSQIVKMAQDYVIEQSGVAYSVTDMCEVTSTSERTLQYAFRKILDMTPIEYLIRVRLHRTRQNLQKANAASTAVLRIAVKWGFWHLGEFSIAYKSCFDEIPSETLKRKSEHLQ
jgi:AraC family ethanolamine operon transcriptional activator